MTEAPPNMLQAALALAAQGFKVIPCYTVNLGKKTEQGYPCSCPEGPSCKSAGKHPRLIGWEVLASSDPEKIREWWGQWPVANIGIATGPSGVFLLETDGQEGAESLTHLIQEKGRGEWAETRRALSGSREGTHYYFKAPPDLELRNKQSWKVAPKVDVRAWGGQVIAAPSLHKSGNRYEWVPGTQELAPAPGWLVDILRKEQEEKAAKAERATPREKPEGEADNEWQGEPSPRTKKALASWVAKAAAFDSKKDSRTNFTGGCALDLYGFVKSRELGRNLADETIRKVAEECGYIAKYGESEFRRQVLENAWANATPKEESDHPSHKAWRQRQENGGEKKAGGEAEEKKSVAALLVDFALAADVDLWKTPEGEFYATFQTEHRGVQVRENHPLKSKAVRRWLAGLLYARTGRVPGSQATQDASLVLEYHAAKGETRAVHVRLAEVEGRVYLDIGDDTWEAIEIDALGWRIVREPPVRFKRPKGLEPLPRPEPGGQLEELRPFINTPKNKETEDREWKFAVAWLLGALRGTGPFPILNVTGEHGSAKSTTEKHLRALIDPNSCMLRTTPREERELAIAAGNGWVLAYDNLSGLPGWLSDSLCRLATGGGMSVRTLHTDDEETLFAFTRPVLLNGINDVATRADLADRMLSISTPRIKRETRKREAELKAAFDVARPKILGALLDVVAAGLKRLPEVQLVELPRMADFAWWIAACEPALGWAPGSFARLYFESIDYAAQDQVEGDNLARRVRDFALAHTAPWVGLVSDLLSHINKAVPCDVREAKDWPQDATRLSKRLRRMAPSLREVGVEIEFLPRSKEGSKVKLGKAPEPTPGVATDRSDVAANSGATPGSPADSQGNVAGEGGVATTPPYSKQDTPPPEAGAPCSGEAPSDAPPSLSFSSFKGSATPATPATPAAPPKGARDVAEKSSATPATPGSYTTPHDPSTDPGGVDWEKEGW